MYNLIAIMFIIIGIVKAGHVDNFEIGVIFACAIGFAIAGSIGSLASSIDNIFNGKIKYNKRDLINGDTEIKIEKVKNNNFTNTNQEK